MDRQVLVLPVLPGQDQEIPQEAEAQVSDRSDLCALLDRWGVPWARCGDDIDVGRAQNGPDHEKVCGCRGFYTLFEFTEEGEFVRMGAWE